MGGDYPLGYDRLYNPDAILSWGFIVSRAPDPDKHCNEETSLWVWNPFVGITSMLPPPPIPLKSQHQTKFVCDGDRVYALYAHKRGGSVREEQNVGPDVYHVWMLNLREFNIRWKKLPPLPIVGRYVYASSCGSESYIRQRRTTFATEECGIWKLSASGEENSEWHWQYIEDNTPPPRNINFETSDKVPSYIQMDEVWDADITMSFLYVRDSHPYLTPGNIIEASEHPPYIILLAEVDGSQCRPVIYYLGIDAQENGPGLYLLKRELDSEKTRTVKREEWTAFLAEWVPEWLRRVVEDGQEEDGQEEDDELEENLPILPRLLNQRRVGAIKFFRCKSWKREHWLNLGNQNNETQNKICTIEVTHFGHIFAYKFLIGQRGNIE